MPARNASTAPASTRIALVIGNAAYLEAPLDNPVGDARAIAEVVYNLIENAVKYSPDQTTITITAVQRANTVLISVADEGKGIPPEMRERVFEKFVRLDGSHSDGLGLGLAIARGIVEAQNGRIEITSGDSGVGTKVTLTLQIGE